MTEEKKPSTDGSAPERTEVVTSKADQLAELIAQATALYGVKDYVPAAEVYSQATELQAEINGEMSIENADLLYAYGRCLFYVAQKTSTVLGGTAAQAQLAQNGDKKVSKKRKANGILKDEAEAEATSTSRRPDVVETDAPADVVSVEDAKPEQSQTTADKPYFHFEGDDGFDDSDGEDEGSDAGEQQEDDEEEDDFATSFELLDLARILYLKKVETKQEPPEAGATKERVEAAVELSPDLREIKTRIADIYDLQAEISLEGEKFHAAVSDLKACLALKEELELPQSSLLAECHYKLSLALEAAGQDQQRDADGNPIGEITINWDLRNEAIAQQERAIDSCKLRVAQEMQKSEALLPGKEKDKALAQIEDVQGMISEMQDRLADLKKPPVSVRAETESDAQKEMMSGILGQIMGGTGSKEQQRAELAKVMAGAQDLSGMVKKKKRVPSGGPSGIVADDTSSNASASSKRKVEFADEQETNKKARVEDVEDSGQ